jgi:hypothetical protein
MKWKSRKIPFKRKATQKTKIRVLQPPPGPPHADFASRPPKGGRASGAEAQNAYFSPRASDSRILRLKNRVNQ